MATEDFLSDIVSHLRVTGSIRFGAPWGIRIPALNVSAFHYVERGGCFLRFPADGTRGATAPMAMAAGDFVFLPRGQAHILSDRPTTPSSAFFRPSPPDNGGSLPLTGGGKGAATELICGEFHATHSFQQPLFELLPAVVFIPGDSLHHREWLDPVLRMLTLETAAGRPGKEAAQDRLLGLMMINLLRAYDPGGKAVGRGWLAALHDDAIARAIGRMHAAPEREWTIAALAREAAMSRSSFAARFGSRVGIGPFEYLTRWRMQLAAEYLQDTSLRLDQVAESVGYASEAAFSRAFKKRFHLSPGTWRQERRARVIPA